MARRVVTVLGIVVAVEVVRRIFGLDALAFVLMLLGTGATVGAFMITPANGLEPWRPGFPRAFGPILLALTQAGVAATGAIGGRPGVVIGGVGVLLGMVIFLARSFARTSDAA